jgi:hypothetical protein
MPDDTDPPFADIWPLGRATIETFENPEHSRPAWPVEVAVNVVKPLKIMSTELCSIINGELSVIFKSRKTRTAFAFVTETE